MVNFILPSMVVAITSLPLLAFAAIGPIGELVIKNQDVSPDGFTRSAIVAGSSVPGVPIIGQKGDRFEITVKNELNDNTMLRQTAVHWHGIFHKKETIWADGAAGITQCPIVQGHSFTYKFNSGDQAGTFWYHSHYGTQYCDGLRGPLVIYDPRDPQRWMYDVDDESTILTLGEWYHAVSGQVVLPPVPDSILFNGKGRYVGGSQAELAVLNVRRGKRYRIRLISTSCEPLFHFKIDGHDFTIIEADGQAVWPKKVDALTIYAGQRYSLVLHANRRRGNYWMRALPNLGPSDTYENGVNSAILRYAGAPNEEPTTSEDTPRRPFHETMLHPLRPDFIHGKPKKGGADFNLDVEMALDYSAGPRYQLNGASFSAPSVPVLLQIMSGVKPPQELLPSGSVYGIERDWTVEVTLHGGAPGGPHPFHLHGHTFQVIKSAGSKRYNYLNPVRRDVVVVGDTTSEEDITVIRFKADRAGPFLLHCHSDWHLEYGMALMFAENLPALEDLAPPQDWNDLCPIFDGLPAQDTEVVH